MGESEGGCELGFICIKVTGGVPREGGVGGVVGEDAIVERKGCWGGDREQQLERWGTWRKDLESPGAQ